MSLTGHALACAFSHKPLTAEAFVWEIYGGQSTTGQVFIQVLSGYTCHCHSSGAPHTYYMCIVLIPEGQMARALLDIGEQWIEKVRPHLCAFKGFNEP